MTTTPILTGTTDVPAQVFKAFIKSIEGAAVPPELVARLHKTLLEDRAFSDSRLKAAVLGEEPTQ